MANSKSPVRGVTENNDLSHITQVMYKQNMELVDSNKTLALLRKIDEIVLSSVTSTDEVVEELASTMALEADFSFVGIFLCNNTNTRLSPVAIELAETEPLDLKSEIGSKHIVLKHTRGEIAKAVKHAEMIQTHELPELFGPHTRKNKALESTLGIKNFFICPLQVRDEVVGVLILGTSEADRDISAIRRDLIGRLAGTVGIAIDNTLLYEKSQEATARLRQANNKLKDLDKAKDEFISMASHQLRTPLTTIKGYLSMMLEGDAGEISETQKQFVGYAFEGADRMVNLIADLLNVSRLSAGRFMIEAKPSDLGKIVEDEVRQLQSHAAAKKLKLIYNAPKQALPIISLDDGKTRQVIMNFIDNAIYYTKEGKITVTASRVDKAIRVTVQDTGIGVPPAAQKKLFSKFFRAENAQTVRPDGTGLGLYLAKRVIEDQGGTIIFESAEGKGSTFGFELPLSPATPTSSPKKVLTP